MRKRSLSLDSYLDKVMKKHVSEEVMFILGIEGRERNKCDKSLVRAQWEGTNRQRRPKEKVLFNKLVVAKSEDKIPVPCLYNWTLI